MKMKKINVLFLVLSWLALTSSVWARQIVSDEEKDWAKKVLEQETTLDASQAADTVALLYFNNKTDWAKLDPLKKGLVIMLMSDIERANLEGIRLVERTRLQALVNEMQMAEVIPFDAHSKFGKLLGAEHVIGGDILKSALDRFELSGSAFNVPTKSIFGTPQTQGKLLVEFFQMEKDLLFQILALLGVELTPEQKEELQKFSTVSERALMLWFEGISFSDSGDFARAYINYKKALQQDPGLADILIPLIEELQIVASQKGINLEDDEVLGYTKAETDTPIVPTGEGGPTDNGDPPDRRLSDQDGDGFSVTQGDCNDNDPNVNPGRLEICDDIDNDCNGAIDDGVSRSTSCGVGECFGNTGIETCVAGTWGNDTCEPLAGAGAEICDNLDNDCDGSVDENLTQTTSCGVGECFGNTGIETCVAGTWGNDTCEPLAGAGAEICDNLDNDCDGSVDENLTQTTSCGVGECFGNTGIETCVAGAWGNDTCEPLAGAGAEICDNLDNDCDGSVDENLTQATSCGVGECLGNTGFVTCSLGMWGDDTCDSLEGAVTESCDGLDNNCNGSVDEGLGQTTCGLGECVHTIDNCVEGVEQTCNPLEGSVAESCDGLDNNCDGGVDEGLGQTTCGIGECAHTIDNCIEGTEQTCDPLEGAIEELCNGLDDDCDGVADGSEGLSQSCGLTDVGVCTFGTEYCTNDGSWADCSAVLPEIGDASCNGLDEDCDGATDEDWLPTVVSCGIGECQASAESQCVTLNLAASSITYEQPGTCVPGSPGPEMCDGLDNDCDSTTDEICAYPIVDNQNINTAAANYNSDSLLADEVDGGAYQPGILFSGEGATGVNSVLTNVYFGYEWDGSYNDTLTSGDTTYVFTLGLQTMGTQFANQVPQHYLSDGALDRINSDPFLAYAVQVEEDVLNRESLGMLRQAAQTVGNANLATTINTALTAGTIRSRDTLLLMQADAQSGRVLWDQEGNLVRTQQYIFRPDSSHVQLVDVNLRGTGPHTGISVMEWNTTFRSEYGGNLQNLPWEQWLYTRTMDDGTRYSYIVDGTNSINTRVSDMNVRISNNVGQYFSESRDFTLPTETAPNDMHFTNEVLTLNLGGDHDGTYTYTGDNTVVDPNQYWVEQDRAFAFTLPGYNPAPLYYFHRTAAGPDGVERLAYFDFYVVGDGNLPNNRGVVSNADLANNYSNETVGDIWMALNANETEIFWIGPNNLEMKITSGEHFVENAPLNSSRFQQAAIDIVYSPMSRMVWNKYYEVPQYYLTTGY